MENMTNYELFDELDMNGDGRLSREDIRRGAIQLGWHWQQAPIYALLDFLTIRSDLDKDAFLSCMTQISLDENGVYGQVLRRGPQASMLPFFHGTGFGRRENSGNFTVTARTGPWLEGAVGQLKNLADDRTAGDFTLAMERLKLPRLMVRSDETALLIIDPQFSFTAGEWMRSMGQGGEAETMPIRLAFDNCARLLEVLYRRVNVMFTRCPFPPGSYGWDDRLDGIIDPWQPYFIKPSNNVLLPAANGFREWVAALASVGIKTLVMGGCTLNSCLRVSAVETWNYFPGKDLAVIADLSLCGARTSNYLNSALFQGMSPVETAIRQMSAAGVLVADSVEWVGK